MKRLDWKYLPIGVLFVLSTALAPVFRAQEGTTVTRVRTDPPDAFYSVDGAIYSSATNTVWAPGSKHVLNAISPQNPPGQPKAIYVWKQWEFGDSVIKVNPAPVTATNAISGYLARFDVGYAITLVFFNRPETEPCSSPGRIQVDHD